MTGRWVLFDKAKKKLVKTLSEAEAQREIAERNAGRRGGWKLHDVRQVEGVAEVEITGTEVRTFRHRFFLVENEARVLETHYQAGTLPMSKLMELLDAHGRPPEEVTMKDATLRVIGAGDSAKKA